MMGGPAVTTHHYDWFEIFAGIIFILILSVALLAISSFGTLFMLSSNIVLPVKSLIAITLVVYDLNFVIQDCGECRFGGRVSEVGAQNSVLSAALPKQLSLAAIGLHSLLILTYMNIISANF